jgi:hypothetical protein
MTKCKNCKQQVVTVDAPPDHKGCAMVWVHSGTRSQRCYLPPKYAEPEEHYDHAGWVEANGPGR